MKSVTSLLLFVLSLSCSRHIGSGDNELNIVLHDAKTIHIDDLLNNKRIVKLETNDSCLIGIPAKIVLSDEYIYVSDMESVNKFDMNGSHVNSIKKRGRGPGEYTEISDFNVLTNGDIIILNADSKKILRYTSEGVFSKKTNLKCWAQSFAMLGDSIAIINCRYNSYEKYKFRSLNINNGQVLAEFYDMPSAKCNYMHFLETRNFSMYDGKLLFNELFNPHIYEVTEASVTVRYFMNLNGNTPSEQFFDTNYSDVRAFLETFHNGNFYCGSTHFAESAASVLFSYNGNKAHNHCLLEKGSLKSAVFQSIILSKNSTEGLSSFDIFPQSDGCVAISFPTAELVETMGDEDEFMSSIHEYDNPIICIGEIK